MSSSSTAYVYIDSGNDAVRWFIPAVGNQYSILDSSIYASNVVTQASVTSNIAPPVLPITVYPALASAGVNIASNKAP